MYVRREAGPRVVALRDGSILSRADLPPADTVRWVWRRKATVARAVQAGLISAEAACRRYRLSEPELQGWIDALEDDAPERLKATHGYGRRLRAGAAAPRETRE